MMPLKRSLVVLSFLCLANCSGGDRSTGPDDDWPAAAVTPAGSPSGPLTTAVIGPGGGRLVTPDSLVSLEIPAGAMTTSIEIGIQSVSATAPGGIRAMRFTPADLRFAAPVRVTLRPTAFETATAAAHLLTIGTQLGDGRWQLVDPEVLDALPDGTISFQLGHFSDYALIEVLRLHPGLDTIDAGESVTLTAEYCSTVDRVRDETVAAFAANCSQAVRPGVDADVPDVVLLRFDPATWAVNGVTGGDSNRGTVEGGLTATYTPADPLEAENPVTIRIGIHGVGGTASASLSTTLAVITTCGRGTQLPGPLGVACRPPALAGTVIGMKQIRQSSASPWITYRSEATVEWVYDPNQSGPGSLAYRHRGTVILTPTDPCITFAPDRRSWNVGDPSVEGWLVISNQDPDQPLALLASAAVGWMIDVTDSCSGAAYTLNNGGTFIFGEQETDGFDFVFDNYPDFDGNTYSWQIHPVAVTTARLRRAHATR